MLYDAPCMQGRLQVLDDGSLRVQAPLGRIAWQASQSLLTGITTRPGAMGSLNVTFHTQAGTYEAKMVTQANFAKLQSYLSLPQQMAQSQQPLYAPYGGPPPPPQQPIQQQQGLPNSAWQQPMHQQYPSPPQPPQRKKSWIRRHPIWSCLIGLIVISCIYGAINDATTGGKTAATDSTASASPTAAATLQDTPTQAPTPTPKLTPQQRIEAQSLKDAQGASIGGKDITTRYDTDAHDVTVTEFTDGGFSNSGTVDIIKLECFDMQKAIWQDRSLKLSSVEVHVTGTLQDQYGHTSTGLIGSCTLDSGTAAQFAWDNLTSDSAWGDYDLTYLLPSLNS